MLTRVVLRTIKYDTDGIFTDLFEKVADTRLQILQKSIMYCFICQ